MARLELIEPRCRAEAAIPMATEPLHSARSVPKSLRLRSKPYDGLNYFLNSPRQNSPSSASRPARASMDATATTNPQSLMRRYEQYMVLARETAEAGERIEAESFPQHSEHFYRAAILQKVGQPQ